MILDRLHTGLAGLALAGAGLFLYEWHASTLDRAKMEAVKQAQDTVIANAQKTIQDAQADRDEHEKADAARNAFVASQLSSMAQAVAALKTPQQQAQWSQDQLAAYIKGITITTDKQGNATANIPAASLADLPATIEKCRVCEINLGKAQADVESRVQQMADAQKEIDALKTQKTGLTTERDAALKAAKGGGWIQRTVRVLKVAVVAGAVGYLAGKKF